MSVRGVKRGGVEGGEKEDARHVGLIRSRGTRQYLAKVRAVLLEIFLDCWLLIHLGYSQEFATLINRGVGGAEYANICSQKLSKRKSEEKIFSEAVIPNG